MERGGGERQNPEAAPPPLTVCSTTMGMSGARAGAAQCRRRRTAATPPQSPRPTAAPGPMARRKWVLGAPEVRAARQKRAVRKLAGIGAASQCSGWELWAPHGSSAAPAPRTAGSPLMTPPPPTRFPAINYIIIVN